MAKVVDLTENEVKLITDLLGWWKEGYAEAKDMTIGDESLEIEELLVLSAGYDEDEATIASLMEKLACHDPIGGPR